jgi:hypothetical protein
MGKVITIHIHGDTPPEEEVRRVLEGSWRLAISQSVDSPLMHRDPSSLRNAWMAVASGFTRAVIEEVPDA